MEQNSKPQNGLIAIAQINTTAGNIEANAQKIVKYISDAQNKGAELIIFPELALTGNPLGDTVLKYPNLISDNKIWLKEIAKISTSALIIGFAEIDSTNNKKYTSAAAVIQNGEITDLITKTGKTKINNKNYLISTGKPDFCGKDIESDIEAVILLESVTNTETTKKEKIELISQQSNSALIWINQTGAIDNVFFDGSSCVYKKGGELLARAKNFDEELLIFNIEKGIGEIYETNRSLPNQNEFTLDYDWDLDRVYNTALQGIRDYFGKNGFKRAVLGLSGGLDSAVCAVLLADALGAEKVLGISMPSKITSSESKSDAKQLAENLGINFWEKPIKDIVEVTSNTLNNLFDNIENQWDCRYKKSYTADNIQARTRAIILWGISNEFDKCLPIATSDKSEIYMGYATINGDMSGGYAPVADITKTKLFALARWLNKNRKEKNAIPENIILKKPGAELAIDPKTGKPLIAEDALMPYEFMDEVIWRIENRHENYNDMADSTFLYEKNNNITKEQKLEWLDKFYKRMAGALYKGTILPPFIIIDSTSLNKYTYSQPITSAKINYKPLKPSEIKEKINSFI